MGGRVPSTGAYASRVGIILRHLRQVAATDPAGSDDVEAGVSMNGHPAGMTMRYSTVERLSWTRS